jgi:hypothetical protein
MNNNKMNLTIDEQETTITWDYAADVARVYTTKESVIRNIRKRLGDKLSECMERDNWCIDIPLKHMRPPQLVTKA